MKRAPVYGYLAEFESATDLVGATRRAYAEGYRKMDAYSPFPIEEAADALGFHKTRVPLVVLVGGILGGGAGYLLQWWINVIAYPLNVGGKPMHAWPSFIVVTFEMTVLFAGLAALFGMLALNGLPMPYHPLFNVPRFAMASRDRFFLCIEAADPKFDPESTRAFMESLQPHGTVLEVPD